MPDCVNLIEPTRTARTVPTSATSLAYRQRAITSNLLIRIIWSSRGPLLCSCERISPHSSSGCPGSRSYSFPKPYGEPGSSQGSRPLAWVSWRLGRCSFFATSRGLAGSLPAQQNREPPTHPVMTNAADRRPAAPFSSPPRIRNNTVGDMGARSCAVQFLLNPVGSFSSSRLLNPLGLSIDADVGPEYGWRHRERRHES